MIQKHAIYKGKKEAVSCHSCVIIASHHIGNFLFLLSSLIFQLDMCIILSIWIWIMHEHGINLCFVLLGCVTVFASLWYNFVFLRKWYIDDNHYLGLRSIIIMSSLLYELGPWSGVLYLKSNEVHFQKFSLFLSSGQGNVLHLQPKTKTNALHEYMTHLYLDTLFWSWSMNRSGDEMYLAR